MIGDQALVVRFMKDESGQNLIEYALIACLIGLAAIAALSNMGSVLQDAFNAISNHLQSAN